MTARVRRPLVASMSLVEPLALSIIRFTGSESRATMATICSATTTLPWPTFIRCTALPLALLKVLDLFAHLLQHALAGQRGLAQLEIVRLARHRVHLAPQLLEQRPRHRGVGRLGVLHAHDAGPLQHPRQRHVAADAGTSEVGGERARPFDVLACQRGVGDDALRGLPATACWRPTTARSLPSSPPSAGSGNTARRCTAGASAGWPCSSPLSSSGWASFSSATACSRRERQARLPGLIAALPLLHSGHDSGGYVAAVSVASAVYLTGNVAAPPLRSISEPTPTTTPPCSSTHCTTSRVEPPVVITSSTTRHRSPALSVNPRRSRIAPCSRSVKSARTPSARATSWATRIPPIAGASTVCTRSARNGSASAAPGAAAGSGRCSTRADCR